MCSIEEMVGRMSLAYGYDFAHQWFGINGLDASFNQVVNHLGHKTLVLGAKLLYCLFYKIIDKLGKNAKEQQKNANNPKINNLPDKKHKCKKM